MLLSWPEMATKYRLRNKVTGVIHVGAHLAEEAAGYDSELGSDTPVWWIEANPRVSSKILATLSHYPHQELIEALVTDVDHQAREFHITNSDGMSSSVLEFGTHKFNHPDMIFVEHMTLHSRTLDSLVEEHTIQGCNLLVMDLQGAEAMALRGATKLLESIDFVMSEVNVEEVYQGCAQLPELDELLSDFIRVETTLTQFGWGDSLYKRK